MTMVHECAMFDLAIKQCSAQHRGTSCIHTLTSPAADTYQNLPILLRLNHPLYCPVHISLVDALSCTFHSTASYQPVRSIVHCYGCHTSFKIVIIVSCHPGYCFYELQNKDTSSNTLIWAFVCLKLDREPHTCSIHSMWQWIYF